MIGIRDRRRAAARKPPQPSKPVERSRLVEEQRQAEPLLSGAEVQRQVDRRLQANGPYGPIAEAMADTSVSEILINGPGPVWLERNGRLQRSPLTVTGHQIELLIERILTPLGLRVDRSAPIVDARLPDGSRVNVVVPPLAIDGPTICIRRFGSQALGLADFGPPSMVSIATRLVAQRASILVAGPTSAGKTTLINSLSGLVDPVDRIVCIEDTAELQLAPTNVLRLEARPANSEGVGEVSLRQLVRNALRMRPDRLVVGEVRGAEAFDLLLALTSGHRGALTSCHGADCAGALRRLATLAAMAGEGLGPERIDRLIADGLDAVVTVERVDGKRRVSAIARLGHGHPEELWSVGGAEDRLRAC